MQMLVHALIHTRTLMCSWAFTRCLELKKSVLEQAPPGPRSVQMFPDNIPVVRGFLHQMFNLQVFVLAPTTKCVTQEWKSSFISQRNCQGKEVVESSCFPCVHYHHCGTGAAAGELLALSCSWNQDKSHFSLRACLFLYAISWIWTMHIAWDFALCIRLSSTWVCLQGINHTKLQSS